MKANQFTVGVERLVDPVEVGTLHFIQNLTGALPKSIQDKMIASSAKKNPLMGFVVEPYSYFLGYEVTDLDYAHKLLPDGFKMVKSKMYEADTPKYYGIFGIFNAHTSGFWGLRVEFYLIAEDLKTGLLSWIIIDYDTNTISYDPKSGLKNANASGSIFTIDHKGLIHIDVKHNNKERSLIVRSDITNGKMIPLNKRLWIEGNLSVGYGREKSNNQPHVFSLKFDPHEFDEALIIDPKDYEIEENSWFKGLFKDQPATALCFPYAQHYLSDSPGYFSNLQNEDELLDEINKIDFNNIKIFSTKAIKSMMKVGLALSTVVNLTLLSLLVFT